MKTICILAAFICALGCVLGAGGPEEKKAEVRPISISVSDPPAMDNQNLYIGNKSASVALLVSDPDRVIIGLDDESTKLEKFVDDQQTDLMRQIPGS